MRPLTALAGLSALALQALHAPAAAQTVLFDFESSWAGATLPISLTVGGITAQLSSSSLTYGYSIQPASTMGFTPVGFAGLCVYPSTVYASDLVIDFTPMVLHFSILYATEEYVCDTAARMRATGYRGGVPVATTTAVSPSTSTVWPTDTLQLGGGGGYDRVVVHYDAPPTAPCDYGPIFMADDMQVIPYTAIVFGDGFEGGGCTGWSDYTW